MRKKIQDVTSTPAGLNTSVKDDVASIQENINRINDLHTKLDTHSTPCDRFTNDECREYPNRCHLMKGPNPTDLDNTILRCRPKPKHYDSPQPILD